MARNGYFGVKNTHIALCTDTEKLTYDVPTHIPGTVEVKLDPSVESADSYADNETWLSSQKDNGGSGTLSVYDIENPTTRALVSKIIGYQVDAGGRMLLSAEEDPVPFAFMCEQPGSAYGKRKCLYMCKAKKPSTDAKTQEDKPDITQIDIEFEWKPVTLSSGWRGTGYNDYFGTKTYDDFFEKVDTALVPATTTASGTTSTTTSTGTGA